jgi:3-oxoacyl-[acyl-carrier protein] reductase
LSQRFQSTTVVVTGASRGIGRAIAGAFAAEGAHVVIGYRSNRRAAEQTLDEMSDAGGVGELLAFDLRDSDAVDRAIGHVLDSRGQIDVLVNNAAVVDETLVAMASQDTLDEVIDVNLGGTLRCCRAVARPMMARRSGAIVNVSSVSALRAVEGVAAYAASKAGVLALSRTLAREFGGKGIRVNAVVPGFVSAGMGARIEKRRAEQRRATIPLGRFGDADEIARAVLFLASEEASYINGASLVVDGGLSV